MSHYSVFRAQILLQYRDTAIFAEIYCKNPMKNRIKNPWILLIFSGKYLEKLLNLDG